MDSATLVAEWSELFARPSTGWDFSQLAGVTQENTTWEYTALARDALTGAVSVLDIGTGGGELLLELADVLPRDTVATEGWPPNLPVASAALESLRIPVLSYRAGREPVMPFAEGRFDVVLARHEAYDAAEVARILRPRGILVTQQVEAENLNDLRGLFGFESPYPEQTLLAHVDAAIAAGLTVERAQNWEGSTTFPDVSSLVRYLAMVPWEAPQDFSPERYADVLVRLAARNQPLTFAVRRFLLVARRPSDDSARE